MIAHLEGEIAAHEKAMGADPELHEARILELRWAIARLTRSTANSNRDRTAGPWAAVLSQAEKIGEYEFAVPVYSGGAKVAIARGPTMAIAVANAEFIANAPAAELELARTQDAVRSLVVDVLPAAIHAVPRVTVMHV